MTSDDSLRHLESRRRRPYWTLANLEPGDPRTPCVLRVLDEIDQQEQASLGTGRIITLDEVANQVAAEPHPIGTHIVRDDAIPEPWRECFMCASCGSTRVPEGAYLHDWLKFIAKWKQEMARLERHREAAIQRAIVSLAYDATRQAQPHPNLAPLLVLICLCDSMLVVIVDHHLTSQIWVTFFVAVVAENVHSRIRTHRFSKSHSSLASVPAYRMVRALPAKLTACRFW